MPQSTPIGRPPGGNDAANVPLSDLIGLEAGTNFYQSPAHVQTATPAAIDAMNRLLTAKKWVIAHDGGISLDINTDRLELSLEVDASGRWASICFAAIGEHPTEVDRLAELEHQAWDLIGDLQACLSAVRLIAAGASDLLIERRKQAGIGVYQDQASGAFMLPQQVHPGRSPQGGAE